MFKVRSGSMKISQGTTDMENGQHRQSVSARHPVSIFKRKGKSLISRRAVLALPFVAALATNAFAASYPTQTINLIVPFSAGGGVDSMARMVAEAARDAFGVPVVVSNVPGAGATIGVSRIANAKPDGYTLGFVSNSPLIVLPALQEVPYDPAKDFTYISRISKSPSSVIVRSDSQFQSFKQVIEYGRANPDRISWATPGARTTAEISLQAAFQRAGVKSTTIPTKGGSEAIALLLGKQVDLVGTTGWGAQFAGGTIRVLAEMGPDKIPSLPNVPTFNELGYESFGIFYGLAGPAGIPDEVITKWEKIISDFTMSPRFVQFSEKSLDVASYLGSEEFQKDIVKETTDFRRIAKEVKIID